MKFTAVVVWLALCAIAYSANFYVRPNGGSYGTEDGSDWTNAFDGFMDINWGGVSAGDTIWVAGGTYTQDLNPAASGSSGNVIAVRRARSDAAACTGAAGWSAGFDATVTMNEVGIAIIGNYSYVTISGRTTSAGGSHGWHINYKGETEGTAIFMIGTAANNMESVTSAIFVDFAAKNFHIVDTVAALYPRDKGADLGAPWNVDRDGVSRGEGAAWDVGAYEYAGGGAATSASLSGTVSISGNASIR